MVQTIESQAWISGFVVLYFTLTVLLTLILVVHYKLSAARLKAMHGNVRVTVPMMTGMYLSFPVVGFYLLFNLNMCVSYVSVLSWTPFNFHYDLNAIVVGALLYLCAKTCMYVVFLNRMHGLIDEQQLIDIKKKSVKLLYVLLAFFELAMLLLLALFAAEHKDYSKRDMPLFIAVPILLFDLMFSSMVVWIMGGKVGKQLKNMEKDMNPQQIATQRQMNPEVALFTFKLAIVAIMAIVMTSASLGLLAATGIGILVAFDGVVCSLSLVLMTGPWNGVFFKYFTPCMVCVARFPCLKQDADQIEIMAKTAYKHISDAQKEKEAKRRGAKLRAEQFALAMARK